KKIGGHKIAVGHTAEDQVETVLMNLLRGSGSTGLAGMPETRDAVIRPLQDCFRQELEAYLLSRNLAWRQDPSNLETDYLRNRVRLNLLPLLEAYNPRIRQRLLETARI
ncbi:MAG: hypothetical protein GWM98_10630, partial [Nitrospinaceae bacterium]|nr:tRNA lysidine(34) synthetase TilS [Nitrospinaceae bacterium]NIR54859.1 tRNA lysidine(34) synthetase TilS [Nitrospinaceae bacterium]NIS85284.1 tRNA lysidine(34) synthetase TilS [Nitrospinaceae bacterium]NIT82097.1 tRNA lysidine(34) synthetase TilS [Nitrospinaceae bacterium]NIU44358.1 tRNA lysidine(34) synthetase TilS [Nitrospinaceae bacterium]